MAIDRMVIAEFISALHFSKSLSLDEHFEVYERFLCGLGYDGGTYTFLPQIQIEAMSDLPAIFLSTSAYPMEFLQQYTEERLDEHDFTVRKIMEGSMAPMDWREHELEGLISKQEEALIRLARDKFAIKNAISIPIMYEAKGGAGVSVISYRDDESFSALKAETLDSLVSISRLFHERIFNNEDLTHKFILPVLESLTDKEVAILSYKASGKSMKNIAQHTGMSSSYAANVLGDLRKRMGGVSTDRLMYLLGLLNGVSSILQE